jgi:hypothetical protein
VQVSVLGEDQLRRAATVDSTRGPVERPDLTPRFLAPDGGDAQVS